MEHKDSGTMQGLPENARRALEAGETYVPVVPGETGVPEVTARSVIMGLVFCAIFAMAAAYLALKVGQGIEAAIPIAILAIGIGKLFTRRSSLLENVIVQSIGANSSHVVSGAVFTIPALYMLADPSIGLPEPSVWQVITVSFLGGCLGVLFLIPLRYHFMVEMHGKFPWPEGTATTEILLSGERVGNQAKILVMAAALGGLYDGLVTTFKAMEEEVRGKWIPYFGNILSDNFLTLKMLNNAAIIGIGYIIGLRYAAIICAGSFTSYLVLVPLLNAFGGYINEAIAPGTVLISAMNPDEVFRSYVRIIGVGGIAGAGILGILQSLPSMIKSIGSNIAGMKSQDRREKSEVPRVDRSLSGRFMLVGLAIFILLSFLFFSYGLGIVDSALIAIIGTLLVTLIAFLFAPVAARAIAIVGTNPVSGMTMLTLIITGFVMLKLGLDGGPAMFVTMMVGGVVCTALAASGALASDLKIGHWLGATPAKQLGLKFVGTLVAAVFCGIAMYVMSKQGFGTDQIPAPQASAMKAILVGIFGEVQAPLQWYSFGLGVLMAIILRMCNIPALAFALGMYLPMELNTPVMLGGFLSYLVGRKWGGADDRTVKARLDRGVLVASGLVAGGALMGVGDSFLKAAGVEFTPWLSHEWMVRTAGLGIIVLCTFVVWYSMKARAEG